MKRIPRGSPSWTDDIAYEEEKMREFLRQRESGTLLSQRVAAKQLRHVQRINITPLRPEGWVCYGDIVMIQSAETQGFLSVDSDDVVQEVPLKKIGVTTAPAKHPQYRNAWVVMRADVTQDPTWMAGVEGPDVLHYGQKFFLMAHPDLLPDTYLHSELKTLTAFSKITRQQEVCVTPMRKRMTPLLWSAVYADESFRFEMEGHPVKANSPMLLVHQMTNMPLSSTKHTYANDFGGEWEVSCNKQVARGSLAGRDQNYFVMVTAPPEGTGEEEEQQGEEN
eukprot:PhM_4_TR14794/c0_g1_i1/m.48023